MYCWNVRLVMSDGDLPMCGRIDGVCDNLSAVVDPGPDLKQHRGERSPVDRHSRTQIYAKSRDIVQQS